MKNLLFNLLAVLGLGSTGTNAHAIDEPAYILAKGEPIYSRYNAPFVPWFMRRNEIWLPID